MLFGEWPDRDYFEPGAPLTLAISAALQTVVGRNVWSEYVFCVVALALGSALTLVLAARASGSIVLGIAAFVFQFALLPRLYGYPKVLLYAAGIAAMWAWASRPDTRRTLLVASVTAIAFLFRHDHGVYLGVAFVVLVVTMSGVGWLTRAKQFGLYVLVSLALLTPYLVYLQVNGGIYRHAMTTYMWSVRDFRRSPRILPALDWRVLSTGVPTDAPASEWWEHAPFAALAELSTFWLFWLFMLLPLVVLLLLAVRTPANGTAPWSQERAKMLAVVVVGVAVNYGFLRGNVAGRLADVSVPMAILLAWLLMQLVRIVRGGRVEMANRPYAIGGTSRGAIAVLALAVVAITALVLVRPFMAALENARVAEGVDGMRSAASIVTTRLQNTWPLDSSPSDTRPDYALARYLQICTAPTDRILVTDFRPQILGLAQRGFAGGHVDLRGGGFFGTREEQELTVERWRRQSVPVVIGPTVADLPDWVETLPIVAQYLNSNYANLGEKNVGGFAFILVVRRDARVVRSYAPLDFPCFR